MNIIDRVIKTFSRQHGNPPEFDMEIQELRNSRDALKSNKVFNKTVVDSIEKDLMIMTNEGYSDEDALHARRRILAIRNLLADIDSVVVGAEITSANKRLSGNPQGTTPQRS